MSLSAALVHVSTTVLYIHNKLWCLSCGPWNSWLEQRPRTFIRLLILTFDIGPSVTRGTQNLPANFGVSVTFLCRVIGKYASNWRVIVFHPYVKFEVYRPFWLEDMTDCVSQPGDLDLWSFDFVLVCYARDNFHANVCVSMTFLRRITHKSDDMVTAHVGNTDHGIPSVLFTKFEVSRHSRSEEMNIAFDLSICKWSHGSPVSCFSFLLVFSFLRPAILYLGSDNRADRWT